MVASVASEAGKKAEGPGAAREENGGVFRFGKREGEAGSRESWGGNDGLPSRRTEAGRSGNAGGVSVTDLLRLAVGVLVINCLMSYFVTNESVSWGWRPWFSKPRAVQAWWSGPIRLTDAELLGYDGSDPSKPIYLALNGTIYDVSSARHTYGPGGSYHVFAGKDAARGFITGCFAEDSTPDLRGAEWTYIPKDVPGFQESGVSGEMKSIREREVRKAKRQVKDTIEGWQQLFRGDKGKDYFEVGEVQREDGWLEKLPKRELCALAEKGRPKQRKEGKAKDAGAAYRNSR